MNVRICIQAVDFCHEFLLSDAFGENMKMAFNPEAGGDFLLFVDVGDGGRVFADSYKGDAGACSIVVLQFLPQFVKDFFRDGFTVDNFHGRD